MKQPTPEPLLWEDTYHWPSITRCTILAHGGDGCLLIDLPTGDAEPYIYNLNVRPEARRQGLATKLLNAAEEWCKSRGYKSCRLCWSKDESQQFTYEWYLRRGYEEVAFDDQGLSCEMQKIL